MSLFDAYLWSVAPAPRIDACYQPPPQPTFLAEVKEEVRLPHEATRFRGYRNRKERHSA